MNGWRKTVFTVILLLFVPLLFGCAKNKRQSSDPSNENSQDKTNEVVEDEQTVDVVSVNDAIKADNTQKVIESTDNLYIDPEGTNLFLPDSLSQIYTFDSYYLHDQNGNEYLNDFIKLFQEIYPNETFDYNNLFFVGDRFFNDEAQDKKIPRYLDYKDEVDSGEENVKYFVYDSSENSDDPCFLESTGPIGNNLFRFNRAKGVKYNSEVAGTAMPSFLEMFSPDLYSEYVTSYSPDSEEAFELLDGSMKICDAASFFEDYINGLSCFEKLDCRIKVVQVDLMKYSESIYFYFFTYTLVYEDVPFTYITSGTQGQFKNKYGQPIRSFGAMVRSDEVEYIYELVHGINPENQKSYDKMVSLEDAVRITSEKMTNSVKFSVVDIGLFYHRTEVIYEEESQDQYFPVKPVWRLTLNNENDNRFYRVYIDAVNGVFLHREDM